MLKVTKFRAFSHDKDSINLAWEVIPTTFDLYDYTFTIERSESSHGPWDVITKPFSDRYGFRDVTARQYDRWRQYWYRLKVSRKSDQNIEYSESITLEAAPDLTALEVRRVERILFREHIGRKCWVFPVRTFGQRCPNCYDVRTASKIRSGCPTCYDTTWVRGYLDPIEALFQFDPSPKNVETQSMVETQQQNATARALYFPVLKPRDIIVEHENLRWRVVRVSSTQRLRAVLHQELVLHEVPPTDIEYRLPINKEQIENFQPSPEREFTNPHELSSHGGQEWLTRTLKLYGY